jgi:hypothetical protein
MIDLLSDWHAEKTTRRPRQEANENHERCTPTVARLKRRSAKRGARNGRRAAPASRERRDASIVARADQVTTTGRSVRRDEGVPRRVLGAEAPDLDATALALARLRGAEACRGPVEVRPFHDDAEE